MGVYDYASNRWVDAEEAFSRSGTYELAVLSGPGGERVRVRVMPPGPAGLSIDARSAGDLAVWRAIGVDLAARHLQLLRDLLDGRE